MNKIKCMCYLFESAIILKATIFSHCEIVTFWETHIDVLTKYILDIDLSIQS